MADERCERCWSRRGVERFSLEGMRAVLLCSHCREDAPGDPVALREVFLRFGSVREFVTHYDARDEKEALRKLCVERGFDYKGMTRAIEAHGRADPRRIDAFGRPYGYEQRDGGLRVRASEALTVSHIFEWYLDGQGIAKICRILNEKEIRTKTGKKWASQTVANILRNPLYCGYTKENGSLRRGRHRPIVDPETFSRVQVEMERRIRRPDQRSESKLLRGSSRRSAGEKR